MKHQHLVTLCSLFSFLLFCAASCDGGRNDDGSRELLPVPDKTAGDSPAPRPPDAPADDSAVPPPDASAATPPAPTPPARPAGFTAPPTGCDDLVEVSWSCWTDKFPPELSGKSDVACRHTITCCGSVVQRWEKFYTQAAGASGVAFQKTESLQQRCNAPGRELWDIDYDGVENSADPEPLTDEDGKYPWDD